MQKFITVDGISFNPEWAKTKTKAQFIEHEKHHYKDDPQADKKLGEAYDIVTGKKVGEPEVGSKLPHADEPLGE